MKPMILRTLQVGVALIVVTAVTLLVLLLLGVVGQDAALRTGLNVVAVIAVCTAGGLGLGVLFGWRGDARDGAGRDHKIPPRDQA